MCEKAFFQFVVLVLITAACAAPKNSQDVQILRNEAFNDGLGSYSFSWELSDGSRRDEQGQVKNQGTENGALVVQGNYAWVGPDGVTYAISYTADENGFQPEMEYGRGAAPPLPGKFATVFG